jgi:hypothetical protein
MQPNYRKRRVPHGPSKNELRSARNERDEAQRDRSGSLRQRFPHVTALDLTARQESLAGATLDTIARSVALDEPFMLDIECLGGCGGGVFLLTDAVQELIRQRNEGREGMAICQAASYAGPGKTCGTKLQYQISISYDAPEDGTSMSTTQGE